MHYFLASFTFIILLNRSSFTEVKKVHVKKELIKASFTKSLYFIVKEHVDHDCSLSTVKLCESFSTCVLHIWVTVI